MPEIPDPPDIRRKRRPAHADDEPGARTTAMEAIPAESIETCDPTDWPAARAAEAAAIMSPAEATGRRISRSEIEAGLREISAGLAEARRIIDEGPPPLVEPGEETSMMPAQRALDANFDWVGPSPHSRGAAMDLHVPGPKHVKASTLYFQVGRFRLQGWKLWVVTFILLTAYIVGISLLGARP